MKYSLRKSFSSRRRKEIPDDDHIYPRIDPNGFSNSNSNLVKSNQSKSFLRRRRRCSSSSSSPPPPAPSSSSDKTKLKVSDHAYNNHINHIDGDDDDDPFSPPSDTKTRVRPLDKLTHQIRKSFRNTITRQRPRLESTNSNKHLILKKHDDNLPVDTTMSPISTGLTSPIVLLKETTSTNENDKPKISPKRRKAPLAPTHMSQSISLPNQNSSTFCEVENHEFDCASSSNDQQQNSLAKKSKFNQSFRTRLSLLLQKRHIKQREHVKIQNCIDEDPDHQNHDNPDEINHKKLTISQRFDTLRRSFHLGNRNSTNKGKRHLLSNE
ncbi:unnamed protein product [Rotaria sp. Silwood2]|nr:unnamed protein product [Rotaria sp. Silwood2]CAF2469657.1 unnamed protein product [Rotaria sp. Silwood2]CAF2857534.1 unnamed protein product [Rotaria sp. Silwood2]CAF3849808.1 unnamed protein product [Rotaria sp. Silwood2]CAF4238790.1 unnamed protein product [Rotaria sp. Silwood2]